MTVYLVTTQSVEQDRYGVIQRVHVASHGAYTDSERAASIASDVGGVVTEIVVDRMERLLLQRWENPGYVTG